MRGEVDAAARRARMDDPDERARLRISSRSMRTRSWIAQRLRDPHRYAVGVHHVFVAGQAVLLDGRMTGERPGWVLRSNAALDGPRTRLGPNSVRRIFRHQANRRMIVVSR